MKSSNYSLLKKSESKLIGMVVVFIFGISNVIPSEYNLYDQYLIPL